MMAVTVDLSRTEVRLESPRLIFEREFASGGFITIANYDVLADGSFRDDRGRARIAPVDCLAQLVRRAEAADGEPCREVMPRVFHLKELT